MLFYTLIIVWTCSLGKNVLLAFLANTSYFGSSYDWVTLLLGEMQTFFFMKNWAISPFRDLFLYI